MATQIVMKCFCPGRLRPLDGDEEALSPTLLNLVEGVVPAGAAAVDVGCGAGRLTFAVAPWVQEIAGVDLSPDAIARAESAADRSRLANVRFAVGDAEEVDYRTLVRAGRVDLVVASLCMSDAILRRARASLRRRGALVFAAVEAAQWHEAGRSSRFAYTEPAMRAALARYGFTPDYVGVEREVVEFDPPQQMRDGFLVGSRMEQRWRADGRWEGLERYLDSGGRTLTVRSHLVVRARKG